MDKSIFFHKKYLKFKLWEIEDLENLNSNSAKTSANQQHNNNISPNFPINNSIGLNNNIISINNLNNENSINNPFKTDKPNPFLNNFNNASANTTNDVFPNNFNNNYIINNLPQEEATNLLKDNTNLLPIGKEQQLNAANNPAAIAAYNFVRPKFLYELNGAHTSTVNIIRFSPNGMYLASGGDDSAIVIWAQKSRPVEFGSSQEKIVWSNFKILRGHLSDIYDIAWSPDSKYLISGSVDNRALIWSLEKGKVIDKSIDHNHFVQGVSWDPKNKYVTTQSVDKSAKILCNANIKNEIKFYLNFNLKKYSRSNYAMLMQNLANDLNAIDENPDENKMDLDSEDYNNLQANLSNSNSSSNLSNLNNINKKNNNNNNPQNKKEKNNNIQYFADENQCNS